MQGGLGDVHGGFHVHHHRAHGQGDAAGRNHAAQHVVNENELVAGGIGVAKRGHVHVSGELRPQQVDHVAVLFLNADDAPRGPHQAHADGQALQHVVDVGAEHLLVLVQQGLAFGRIDDDRIGFSGQLDVGGETGAAGADYSRLEHVFQGNRGHNRL